MHSILVIVMHEHLQYEIRCALSRSDLRITTVSNGEEGLRLVGEANFDLVITDMLAEARSGIEVAREIAVEYPSQPIIALSGSSLADSSTYRNLVNQLGVNAFLRYSSVATALTEAVGHVLQESDRAVAYTGRRFAIGSAA